MKRWLVLAVAAIAIAGFANVSFAAVAGSHHDMNTWKGGNDDTCYPCHGIKAEATAAPAELGTVGGLCYARCHDGTNNAAGVVPIATSWPEIGTWDNTNRRLVASTAYSGSATTLNKYGTGAHGMNRGLIPTPDTAAMVQATGWPYTDCATLQCTSCHDVHSNTYSPFLRANLYNATVAAAFCEKCHTAGDAVGARWVTITAQPNGSHPSEVADWSTAAATRNNSGTGWARHGRRIVFKDTNSGGTAPTGAAGDNAVFRNITPAGTTMNSGATTLATRWNPGGKLGFDNNAVINTTTGAVGCYTCHATHLPSAAGINMLVVAKYKTNQGINVSELCVGCHGGNTINDNTNVYPNPGTTAYFHPVEYDSRPVAPLAGAPAGSASTWTVSTGSFAITVNLDNGGIVPLGNTSNLLLCASCHTDAKQTTSNPGVHASQAGTMLLNPKKPSCESCHNTVARVTGTTPNSHHVYGGTTNYTTAANGGYPATINYSGTATANLADGLQCNDCHTFNKTAHNW